MSTTQTRTSPFTRTNARYIATKIAADLHRMQGIYGWPTEDTINGIMEELTELLPDGYVQSLEVGFARDGVRVVSLFYEVRSDGSLADDNAGGVPRGVDISGTERINYLTFSSKWAILSTNDKEAVNARLPYIRTDAPAPSDGSGYWQQDRTYSSNGTGTVRRTFRPFS
jgi:hypothetical protein